MLNHALGDFYKVLILFRKNQGGRHRDFSWRNKGNLEQRCLILDVIPEPECGVRCRLRSRGSPQESPWPGSFSSLHNHQLQT